MVLNFLFTSRFPCADKSRRMRWVGHMACMGEESVQGFGGKAQRDHLEDQGVDGRMESEWILGRVAVRGVEWIQLAQDRGK
jgi:hypothetical protein